MNRECIHMDLHQEWKSALKYTLAKQPDEQVKPWSLSNMALLLIVDACRSCEQCERNNNVRSYSSSLVMQLHLMPWSIEMQFLE